MPPPNATDEMKKRKKKRQEENLISLYNEVHSFIGVVVFQ